MENNLNFDSYLNELLEKASINAVQPSYKCDHCKDTGFIYIGEAVTHCRCTVKPPEKYPLCYAYDIDPKVFKNAENVVNKIVTPDPLQREALSKCNDFFKGIAKKAPFLSGKTPGIGKTLIISYLGYRIAQKRNLRTQFLSITDFKEKCLNCIHEDKPIEAVLNTLKFTIDLLILDDLGAEKVTEFHEENLYNLLNYRYNAEKLTAFTSNYTIENLPYSDRIKSRIHGLSKEIFLKGTDYRKLD